MQGGAVDPEFALLRKMFVLAQFTDVLNKAQY